MIAVTYLKAIDAEQMLSRKANFLNILLKFKLVQCGVQLNYTPYLTQEGLTEAFMMCKQCKCMFCAKVMTSAHVKLIVMKALSKLDILNIGHSREEFYSMSGKELAACFLQA